MRASSNRVVHLFNLETEKIQTMGGWESKLLTIDDSFRFCAVHVQC